MVVIATYNGEEVLFNLLSDIQYFGVPNNKICIVDNKSTDQSYFKRLEDIKYNGVNLIINPNPGYEIGAFKCAIDRFSSDIWFCFQDSIRLRQNIFEIVPPKLTDNNVYTFLTFDNPDLVYVDPIYRFLFKEYNTIRYKVGMVGSMFFARDSVVQRVKNDWAIPKNKWESMASEIGVALAFEKHNIEVIGLDRFDNPNNGTYFEKIFKGRT